jgi:hypothetical protein
VGRGHPADTDGGADGEGEERTVHDKKNLHL